MSHRPDRRRLPDTIAKELDALGLSWRVERTSKSYCLYVEGQRVATFAQTPSDHRAAMNIRADVRRWLRRHGYAE